MVHIEPTLFIYLEFRVHTSKIETREIGQKPCFVIKNVFPPKTLYKVTGFLSKLHQLLRDRGLRRAGLNAKLSVPDRRARCKSGQPLMDRRVQCHPTLGWRMQTFEYYLPTYLDGRRDSVYPAKICTIR